MLQFLAADLAASLYGKLAFRADLAVVFRRKPDTATRSQTVHISLRSRYRRPGVIVQVIVWF
jgi:hypothetical protein